MVTYLYWSLVCLVAGLLLFFLLRAKQWKTGIILPLFVLLVGWAAYHFHFEQLFVKRYGGVMSIEVPEGQLHLATTWKDDNLWVENYDPKTNTCYFTEYSRGNLLEGTVKIENCNPLLPSATRPAFIEKALAE
jgi:hypothetical protein